MFPAYEKCYICQPSVQQKSRQTKSYFQIAIDKIIMKNFILSAFVTCFVLTSLITYAQDAVVSSPDKQLQVSVTVNDGKPMYAVTYKGKTMIENSPLGLTTNEGDFSTGIKYLSKNEEAVSKRYTQDRIKQSQV